MSTVIRYTNGTTISEGFTPVSFTVKSGTTYVVHVRNYGSNVFNHWSDGTTNSYYTITPTQNITLTAYYSTGTTTTTAPSAPQNLQATAGNSQVTLSWTPPSSNGGSAITNYKIYRSTSSGTETLLATRGDAVRIIAVANQKGGVGKTDLTVNVSSTWAPGTPATVTATYPYSISLLGWVVSSGNLTTKTTEAVE